jgi:hypothetical protein
MPRQLKIAAAAFTAILTTAAAHAQTDRPMAGHAHHAMAGAMPADTIPTMPGQDAFGAIQEVVRTLEADPTTDWSKVDIAALCEHLVDMSRVTLDAAVAASPVDGGASFAVTGEGRTRAAILRMVPAHAQAIDGLNGWAVKAEAMSDGVVLTVTSSDPRQAAKIRGLGFFGILTEGQHHQPHHLAMARGQLAP